MNKSFYCLLLLALTTFFVSCISSTQRQPSNAKANEVVFTLFNNDGLLKSDYEYELLDLTELKNNKIQFKKISIDAQDSSKELSEWQLLLKSMTGEKAAEIKFTQNKLPISVKASDFKRLDRALELLAKSGESPNSIHRKQVAVISAFNQNFKDPLDLQIEVLTSPLEFLKRLSPYTINERKHDEHLKVADSSFWTDRSKESIDMSKGPSDLDLAKFDSEICKYAGPKRGFGIHQGLKAKCFDKKFKVKFGEIRAAPLNSKIYHRLGYNVPAIHSIKEIKVAYDRKMFTELNSGKQQYLRIKLLGQQVKSVPLRKRSDFAGHVAYAVLKNTRVVATEEFLERLLPRCGPADQNCHLNDSLYDASFEDEIAFVAFHEIAIVEENNDHEFGAWAFDELDHKHRSEIRALVLVGAFTGNHDLRKDNNKLLWSAKNFEIKHAITDPGSGYGSGKPFSAYDANAMKWNIMREKVDHIPASNGKGSITRTSIVIDSFKPNVDHSVFSKLNLGEAKWMGRLIAGISEDEITEALAASGFSAAELLLVREKLVSMQKNIVEVLDLVPEFPELAARQINQKISYEPKGEDMYLSLKNGKYLSVEEGDYSLVNGVLKKN